MKTFLFQTRKKKEKRQIAIHLSNTGSVAYRGIHLDTPISLSLLPKKYVVAIIDIENSNSKKVTFLAELKTFFCCTSKNRQSQIDTNHLPYFRLRILPKAYTQWNKSEKLFIITPEKVCRKKGPWRTLLSHPDKVYTARRERKKWAKITPNWNLKYSMIYSSILSLRKENYKNGN